jgi:group I intron endonuclease
MKYLVSYFHPFCRDSIRTKLKGKSGIYLVLNNLDPDKFYIGRGISKTLKHNRLYVRFSNHFFHKNKSSSVHLGRAMSKYNKRNFSFHILEFFENEDGITREDFYLKKYDPYYNNLKEAGSSLGYKHTDETKAKMRENYSDERRKRIGELNRNKNLLDETKKLLSALALNRSEAAKANQQKGSEKWNKKTFSKEVMVYCMKDKKEIKRFPSLKNCSLYYNKQKMRGFSYRNVRKKFKEGSGFKYFNNYIIKLVKD